MNKLMMVSIKFHIYYINGGVSLRLIIEIAYTKLLPWDAARCIRGHLAGEGHHEIGLCLEPYGDPRRVGVFL